MFFVGKKDGKKRMVQDLESSSSLKKTDKISISWYYQM